MPVNKTYAYIFLDGNFVPAGELIIEQEGKRVRSEFAYGRRYLGRHNAVSLDPVQLPLTDQRFHALGLFGGIQDASPDGWGRHLLDRAAEEFGIRPSEFDYLTVLDQENRIGALAFGPDPVGGPRPHFPDWRPQIIDGEQLDFEAMIEIADRVLACEELPMEHRRFFLRGSSLGGAQPKAAVEWEGVPCIAKFSREFEAWPTCRVELAAMQLAEMCGIRVARCQVLDVAGRDVFLVQRFDRGQNGVRHHFISARTLTGASDPGKGVYADIALAMRRNCGVQYLTRDLEELFRRMVFNILINNHDDHLLNHGFLYNGRDGGWRLSPAYDVVPQPRLNENGHERLTLVVGAQGRLASIENALSQCEAFGLKKDTGARIIEEMVSLLRKKWVAVNRAAGVSSRKIEAMREAYRLVCER